MALGRFVFAFTLISMVSSAPLCAAAETRETREYAVYVNGKESGSSTLVIVDSDDGKTYVKATATVKVPGIIFPYSFTCESQEWWLKDRLTNLTASSVENGKKTEVSAKAEADRVNVTVNGKSRALTWEIWTASFWRLADRRFHNKAVSVFEPDTGNDMTGKLEFVGNEQLKVGAANEECFRFRVTGIPVPTDLWFDKHHRLVRQEFTEKGQRTIVQLMSRKS